jgi:cytochrome c-type biogenesis protein CcmH/NrfG
MIARPPKKTVSFKAQSFSPLFSKAANDNRPAKRNCMGWILFLAGVLIFFSIILWLYDKTVLYIQEATQWRTDEQVLNSKAKQKDKRSETHQPRNI